MIKLSKEQLRTLGKAFKTVRVKANLTQAELAEELGYSSTQFISNVERGVCLPTTEYLQRLRTLGGGHAKGLRRIIIDTYDEALKELVL